MDIEQRFAMALVRFIRSFGLHKPDQTPCGIHLGVAEAHALSEISNGTLRQMDLAEKLNLSKSTVSRLVDVMVERDLVQRRPAPDDGRGVVLLVTANGMEVATRLAKARADRFSAMLHAVPADRRDDVIEVLSLMEEAARASDRRFAAELH